MMVGGVLHMTRVRSLVAVSRYWTKPTKPHPQDLKVLTQLQSTGTPRHASRFSLDSVLLNSRCTVLMTIALWIG